MSDYSDWIGRTEAHEDHVSHGLVDRFRATIGDACLPHEAAPLGLHWCLCPPHPPMAMLGPDGHPTKGDFLPPIDLPRRMWAASRVTFLKPLPLEAQVTRRSRINSVKEKSGRSGRLCFLEVDEVTLANGEEVIDETRSIVYREAATEPAHLPEISGANLSEWTYTEEIVPTEPLLFRYSAITFNAHRIHYDQAYTTEVENYAALIVHGPLMATLLLQFAAKILGADKVKVYDYRAQSPAYVGQPLHLAARETETGLDVAVIGADGRTVLSGQVHSKQNQ